MKKSLYIRICAKASGMIFLLMPYLFSASSMASTLLPGAGISAYSPALPEAVRLTDNTTVFKNTASDNDYSAFAGFPKFSIPNSASHPYFISENAIPAPPVIICPGNQAAIAAPGLCTALVSGISLVYSDPDNDIVSVTWAMAGATNANSPATGINNPVSYTFNSGVTTMFYIVTDAANNTVTCNFTVTVTDTQLPVISCPSDISAAYAEDSCSANITIVAPTFTDNCGTVSGFATGSRSDGLAITAPYPSGVTTITWTATDLNGNSTSCIQTVTISPGVLLVNYNFTGATGYPVSPNQSASGITCEATSSEPFFIDLAQGTPTGALAYVNNVIAAPALYMDPSNFTNQRYFQFHLSGDSLYKYRKFKLYVQARRGNRAAQTINFSYSTDPFSYTVNGSMSLLSSGIWYEKVVDWSTVDLINNRSDLYIRLFASNGAGGAGDGRLFIDNFQVLGYDGPLARPNEVTIDENMSVVIPVMNNDYYGCNGPLPGTPVSVISVPSQGNVVLNPDGTMTYTPNPNVNGSDSFIYQICDASGSCDTAIVNVTILPVSYAPTVSCPGNITSGSDITVCGAQVDDLAATIYDQDGNIVSLTWVMTGANTSASPLTGINYLSNYDFVTGVSTITYTVVDADGFSDTCSFTVTVYDSENPSMICPDDITFIIPNCASATDTITLAPPVLVDDNCGIFSLTNNAPLKFPVGITSVIWTVVDINGNSYACEQLIEVIKQAPMIVSASGTQVSCFGGNNGTATVSVSGGTPSYTFEWNTLPVQTTQTIINLIAGTYTVVVTDADGCSDSAAVVITQPADSLSLAVTDVVNVDCFGDATGSVTVLAAGGTPAYQYSINGGILQSGGVFPNLVAATYLFTVIDANGCADTLSVTITEPDSALLVQVVVNDTIICAGQTTASATAVALGGVPPYSYVWSTVPVQTTPTATGLIAGTYTISVTDANGCGPVTGVAVITELPPLTVNPAISTPITCAGDSAIITLSASGGTAPYIYVFNGVIQPGDSVFTSIPAGNGYVWSVTDSNGCGPVSGVFNVTEPDSINGSALVLIPPPCIGATATVVVSATGGTLPYTFTFNGVTQIGNGVFTGVPAGTGYVWNVTDANGCTPDSGLLDITEPPIPSASASVTIPIACAGGAATVTIFADFGTPPYTYTLNGVTQVNNGIFTTITAGTGYVWSVIDAAGCGPVTGTIDVTEPPLLIVIPSYVNIGPCGNDTATVTLQAIGGTPPYTYTFNGVTQVGNGVFTPIPPGTGYAWSVDDFYNCGPVAGTLDITGASLLTATASITSPILCGGDSATVTILPTGGTAPFTFTFNGVTQIGNGVFTGIPAGNAYTWSVIDVNGCGPVSDTLSITEPPALNASAIVLLPIPCIGGTAIVFIAASGGTAPLTYTLNGVTQIGNGIFTGVSAGTLAWSVTDANGCSKTGSLQVIEPPIPAATAFVSVPILCPGGNATVTILAASGTEPYTFTFNGVTQVGNGVFTGIPAGSGYAWSVTDANGCGPVAGTLNVNEPPLPVISATVTSPILCFGGTATVTISSIGGLRPFTYTFNGVTQVGDSIFTGIPAGSAYAWSVTDANGCGPVTGTLDVTEPGLFTASAGVTAQIPCTGGTATVTIFANGGTAPYTFTFNGVTQVGNGVFTGIPAGTGYAWSVNDANGCGPVSSTLDVTENNTFSANAVVLLPIPCIGGTAIVGIQVTGGTAPFTYVFNGVTQVGNGIFTGIPAGTGYAWSVTDAGGCPPVTGTLDVIAPPIPSATASVTSPILCAGGTATVTINAFSGTAPYTYTFNGVTQVGDSVFNAIPAGSGYVWSVTDAGGCGPVTDTIDITEPTILVASATFVNDPPCSSGTATVTLTANGGTAPYTYTFNGVTQTGNGVFPSIPIGTGYIWSVTDANGCGPVTNTLNITGPPAIIATAIILNPAPCIGGTASVMILAGGGTAPYTYTFDGVTQVGNGIFTGIPAGTGYIWSVTDANGCGPVTDTIDVTTPAIPTAIASVTSPILCAGGTATVTINASDGTAPYTYTFNGLTQVGNGVFTGIPAGTGYAWSVFDANGCGPVTGFTDVTEPDSLKVIPTYTNNPPCGNDTATVTLLASGGTAPYTFTFNGVTQVGNGVFTLILPGNGYTWSVNDANSCGPVSGTLDITGPTPILISAAVSSPILCAGGTATVTIIASGGTAPYTYTFNGVTQTGNGVFTSIPAGNGYIYSVIDANGCGPVIDTLDVTESNILTATVSDQTFVICTGSATGYITVSASGGTSGYTYSWNTVPAQDSSTAINLPAGSYTVTVTDANGCVVSETAVITEVDPVMANAGPGQMLCNADVTFLVGNSPEPGTGSWAFVSGPNVPNLFPPVGSVAVSTGLIPSPIPYVFSYTISIGGCQTTDTMSVINYTPPTTSYAGIDQEFCSATGVVSTNLDANTPVFGNGTWTQLAGPNTATIANTSDPNTAVSNLIYGTYAFEWTISNGVCQADADVVNIFITQPAQVFAGIDDGICEGSVYSLSSANASNYASLLWTSSGTGIFSDPTITNPVYTPSITDITDGLVVLTLTATGNESCPAVLDAMTLTIDRSPLVNAGEDVTICGNFSYTVTDATAQFYSSILWTTSGLGTLTNSTSLNPTYIPATGETGDILLILSAASAGICPAVSDTMILTIGDDIAVNAGPDNTICEGETYLVSGSSATNAPSLEWTTSGSGIFNDPGILNPVYTPSPNDIFDGFVYLTLKGTGSANCPSVSDVMMLTIAAKPVADAGPDEVICQSSAFTISQAVAQNYLSLTWTTTGTGTLTDENTLNPVYTPASGESGTITLTLLAEGLGSCADVTDVMLLTIQPAATADAGIDLATCELSPISISGASVTNNTSILWTTSGNGTFSDPTSINPVYTPGLLDAAIGEVMLTLTAGANSPCADVSDQLLLSINKTPEANAGPDAVSCIGASHTITQASAANYSSLQWSLLPESAGVLTNATTLSPTYTPAAGFTGMATLTLRVQGIGSCGNIIISDVMFVFLNTELEADAGADQTIYQGTGTQLTGSVTGGSGFYAWSWQPADLLVDPSVSNPVTLPLSTATTFTLTVMDLSTGCTDTDDMTVSIGTGSNSILARADYDTTLVNVPITVNVLSNDINPQGDPLIVSLCGFPTHGIVVLNSDKTITYTPYTDYEGDDMFCYRICNALQPSLCSDTMVYIRVKKPDLNDLFVFNGVSPNGDGNNDTWKIRGIEKYPDNVIMIFNRWGDKVIEFANYNNTTRSWNGSNENGDPLPNGTYFYILDVKNVGVLKGWIYVRGEK